VQNLILPLHCPAFDGQQKYLLKSLTKETMLEAIPTKRPSQMLILQGIVGIKTEKYTCRHALGTFSGERVYLVYWYL
jgi:hypothetical protein